MYESAQGFNICTRSEKWFVVFNDDKKLVLYVSLSGNVTPQLSLSLKDDSKSNYPLSLQILCVTVEISKNPEMKKEYLIKSTHYSRELPDTK